MLHAISDYMAVYAALFFLSWLYFLGGTILVERSRARGDKRFGGNLPFRWVVAGIAAVSCILFLVSLLTPR